ncbi:putative white-brown complex homolog protein 30 isoform X3 [Olea europaea var. sylvestris]|uniref:putative white-brown complex homolog protein 30 isoform X3 n=1 Tax=Olea europaea var. sylvestris TaxID=158386 RepID=UPI000C1CF24C|nr:putative white-brown complex homolog protein 30 isoform X3 [Olea europaea var. sylvestris]
MIEMSGTRINASRLQYLFLILLTVLGGCSRRVWCVEGDEYSRTKNPKVVPLVTALIYSQISNLTKIFNKDITKRLGYCSKDVDADLNEAFNFAGNLDFLNKCVMETKDVTQRMCTAAEMKFYFTSVMDTKSADARFLKPNRNCNLTSWVPGCEPGWACSVAPDQKVNLKNSNDIPLRTRDSQPCCEGFFCPRGLTCMIPCPLGSYCPRANINETTGVCDPYAYQLPPGKGNHTCGAADTWAGVASSEEIFCSAGFYCPTTTKKITCTKGHYCRMGSTGEKACFKLSSCNPNTYKQNMHAYGFILIGALSLILMVFYNCSDQVLSTRHARLAKSRERAARSARETAEARKRWKIAKDVAKKRTVGLQQQLSRTFSRKTGVEASTNESSLPPKFPSNSSKPTPAGKEKKSGNLTKMLQSIENDSDSHEGFHLQIGDKNIKKQMPKAKQLHTKSQIFKYAYGQLEKEKAMEQKNKNLTFSGVISMATDTDIRTRPTIEVSFKDLTITLKKKHKHLMRSVTGKILPGRISAVMGPSGAGKTTFLSAVAGKSTGCTMSGSILVNGKPDSIHCYKKITGFVPQDDIVHGNLTVEENLRFSARCRLSADMPKPDKVLVVERVIESLGLQLVRDSLVGTVEKRGISGGQRKRVNVGLEMVMEPSLLILDEPTSGLDSASSNLLLRALRREALEGVNICMVLHQPRSIKQRLREAQLQAADFLILLLAGACLGTLSQVKGDTFGYHGYMYTIIAVSLLCKISALRSFSLDKLHYRRENDSGTSSLAYFMAKDTVDHFNTLIKPLVFLSMFFFFNNPRSTFTDNYVVLLCLVYCVTGIAYVFAIFFPPSQAQLWCVLLPVVLTLIANQGKDDKIGKYLGSYSYPKWALEAFLIANAQRYSGVWLITRCDTLNELGYSVQNWTYCLVLLIITGIGYRLLAFFCLLTFGKK